MSVMGSSRPERFRLHARSVDGLHVSDLQYITTTLLPNGNLSYLSGLGTTYSNASTSAPSDSFPGIMALHSGARLG